jgi:hypothetical protein
MKVMRFVRFFLWAILALLVLLCLLFFFPPPPEQALFPQKTAYPSMLSEKAYNIDSLYYLYGSNKQLAPGYELQCLLALSAYPELKEAHIDFILQEGGAPMESTFDYLSLLGKEKSRSYKILLNDSEESSFLEPILLRNLPFDAQTGILVHELGHTVYYRELNLFQIISWALNYGLRPSYRATHERSTDELTIYQGMGWQILQYAEFVRYDASTKDLYANGKVFMDTFYLTPEEIERSMTKSGMYE